MRRILKIGLSASFLMNVIMFYSTYYRNSYDSYVHIFFADSYLKDWFNTWDPRWFGGFDKISYPPLAHQLLALSGKLFGNLEIAYAILSFAFALLLPYACYLFAKIFVDEEEAGYAALAAAFLPASFLHIYPKGQFTSLVALVFALFAFVYLNSFLEKGNTLDFLIAVFLATSTTASHHLTGIFFLVPVSLIIVLKKLVDGIRDSKRARMEKTKSILLKSLLFFLCVGALTLIFLYPFIMFSLNFKNQAFMRHESKGNIFQSWSAMTMYFLSPYYPVLLFLLIGDYFIIKNKRLSIPLILTLLASTYLFIFSLGGTTPIPSLVIGERWNFLIYDRWAWWCTIMLLPFIGFTIKRLYTRKPLTSIRGCLLIILMVTMVLASAHNSAWTFNINSRPVDTNAIADFLNNDQHWHYRFITLDFGSSNVARLNTLTNATLFDGFYDTARTLPVFTQSGINEFDSAKYNPNGMQVLANLLTDAPKYSLKFVFCADAFYEQTLEKTGFRKTIQDIGYGVTVWECSKPVPWVPEEEFSKSTANMPSSWIWGLTPLNLLAVALLLLYQGIFRKKDSP